MFKRVLKRYLLEINRSDKTVTRNWDFRKIYLRATETFFIVVNPLLDQESAPIKFTSLSHVHLVHFCRTNKNMLSSTQHPENRSYWGHKYILWLYTGLKTVLYRQIHQIWWLWMYVPAWKDQSCADNFCMSIIHQNNINGVYLEVKMCKK